MFRIRTTWPIVTSALFAAAAAFATGGFDVIVDTVFERPASLEAARRALAAHPYQLVAVTCALDVLEERERARGDRRRGQAREQFERVLQGARYDLTLDTTRSSVDDGVDALVALLRN